MPPLRIVLDNNVVVSTLLFSHGALSWLSPAWRTAQFVPLASLETLAELRRVLDYRKFALSYDDQVFNMNYYRPWCEIVTITEPQEVPDCRDPRDRPFLELALYAQADALVTGDGDLLELAPMFAVPIITPSALRTLLQLDR